LAIAGLAVLAAVRPAGAERLPVRLFSMADGLAQNRVKCIVSDSRGFLWLCTPGGLSRYDGGRFVSFGPDVLSHRSVNAIVEASDGTYWIATNGGGIVRFDPAGRRVRHWPPRPSELATTTRFTELHVGDSAPANRVNALHIDRSGRVWAGTDDGLFRYDGRAGFEPLDLDLHGWGGRVAVWAFAEDAGGTLWIGTTHGLVRRLQTGELQHHAVSPGIADNIRALAATADGRIWIAHDTGLFRATQDESGGMPAVDIAPVEALRDRPGTRALFATGDTLWVGFADGVLVAYDGEVVRRYGATHGLPPTGIRAIGADADGNLWIGYSAAGVARMAKDGFRTYGRDDGLQDDSGNGLLETRTGEVCVVSGALDGLLQCFDGATFVPVRPNLPAVAEGWQLGRRVLQDLEGDWWFGTSAGVVRLPNVARLTDLAVVAPRATYTAAGGGTTVEGLFEDSRGDVWIWTGGLSRSSLSRWVRAADRVVPVQGLSPSRQIWDVEEDAGGNIWIAFRDGGVARWRNGRFETFGPEAGVPHEWTGPLYSSRAGRLWIGTSRSGVLRVDAPGSGRPQFLLYTTAQGLTQNQVGCFAEDRWRYLYMCVGDGVDRLDPERQRVRHYSVNDGLAGTEVTAVLADQAGTLWFATRSGISRLVPERDDPHPPRGPLVSSLRIGGVPYPLSALGDAEVPEVTLPVAYAHIDIEYASRQDDVRFQYRLDGIDEDWRPPTRDRTVSFANLAPGSYRFRVRALGPGGAASVRPAVVSFTVLPPIWLRWWFLATLAIGLAGAAYAAHRVRVTRLVALERIRTRIATDLHDDIGASLSRISILSEVVSRELDGAQPSARARLASVAETARELVDSMSDIVWAINPAHDRLGDLAGRMRRFASDLLASRDIELRFDAPADGATRLPPDVRRELFLVFKEAVNNAVRHAGCTGLDVALRCQRDRVELTVADNGRGLPPEEPAGHGLASLRARATRLGGVLDIASEPGRGTTIHMRVPPSFPTRRRR